MILDPPDATEKCICEKYIFYAKRRHYEKIHELSKNSDLLDTVLRRCISISVTLHAIRNVARFDHHRDVYFHIPLCSRFANYDIIQTQILAPAASHPLPIHQTKKDQ